MPLGNPRTSSPRTPRATSLLLGAWSLAAVLSGVSVSATAGSAAHLALLSFGDRESLVVDLDEEIGATSIEATDHRSLSVDIGPVKGKVVNEVLEAARRSPLVDHVRVRGITKGRQGTLISIQIVGKSPLSGSVRQAQRRVYIDLAPLAAEGDLVQASVNESTGRLPSAAPTSGSSPTSSTEPDDILATAQDMARTLDVRGLERLAASRITSLVLAARVDQLLAETREKQLRPESRIARGEGAAAPVRATPQAAVNTAGPRATTSGAAAVSMPSAVGGPPPAVAPVEASSRAPSRAQSVASAAAPVNAGATSAPTRAANAAATPAQPTSQPTSPHQSASQQTSSQPTSSQPPSSAPTSARPSGRRTPNPRVFRQGMHALKAELEQLNGTMNTLAPGSVVAGELAIQMETMLARLQALEPPEELGSSHKRACGALSKLLGGWVKAPDGELVLAVASDPATLENTRTSMRDYLVAFDGFDALSASRAQRD